jgi:hypothetical protein
MIRLIVLGVALFGACQAEKPAPASAPVRPAALRSALGLLDHFGETGEMGCVRAYIGLFWSRPPRKRKCFRNRGVGQGECGVRKGHDWRRNWRPGFCIRSHTAAARYDRMAMTPPKVV